ASSTRNVLSRELERARARAQDVVTLWADLLTDRQLLGEGFDRLAPGQFTSAELDRVHAWCVRHVSRAVTEVEERAEAQAAAEERGGPRGKRDDKRREDGEPRAVLDAEDLGLPRGRVDEGDGPRELGFDEGVDGQDLEERATLDREDDTLLLRLLQRTRGVLRRGQNAKEALVYEHVLVDEAQDLSPVELAVVVDTLSRGRSVTLAGDTAQRLHMDNGFTDWKTVLGELGLEHVE